MEEARSITIIGDRQLPYPHFERYGTLYEAWRRPVD